ncbi:MAG: arginine--tRNA ligase [Thermoplasmata archaeon]|nr:arginine--tRNA ligase [Thermoplasmata archaeon]
MLRDPWAEVEDDLRGIRRKAEEKLAVERLNIPLEIPPEGLGDICFPAFQYSQALKASPEDCASRIVSAMDTGEYFSKHEAVRGYVNSFIDWGKFTPQVVESVLSLGSEFGCLDPKDEKVLLEHTSVNPTGPVHIGRSRNSIIGDTLARVLRRAGYDVTTEFLVNDTGRQMVVLTWATQNISEDDLPKAGRDKDDHLLVRYYQKAYEILESDPTLEKTIEELVLKLDRGEEKIVHDVKAVAERVMRGMVSTLEEIGVSLDSYFWESGTILDGSVHEVIESLKRSENAHSDEGAYYLDLESFGIHGWDARFFFTRKDGTSLYTTRDIAYHLGKFKRCDIAINVLGEDQKLGMKQLTLALNMMGVEKRPETVFYAFVSLPTGKMSTRSGTTVLLDDLIDESRARAAEEVRKRRPELSSERIETIASSVGTGAVRYNILRVQPEKRIVFKWEEALNFEGNSAPFIQYSHARASSILRKAPERTGEDFGLLTHPSEILLVNTMSRFPSVIRNCAETRRVHSLASYAHDLSSNFNQFYRDCGVIHAEPELRDARSALVECAKIVLASCLDTMGIEAPEEM